MFTAKKDAFKVGESAQSETELANLLKINNHDREIRLRMLDT